jgi:hypothetical protein
MSDHERPVEPFSDLHVEGDHVRAVLLHDPTVEGLDMALYLDGSGSMKDEYEREVVSRGIGQAPTTEVRPNQVEPQARWMLDYLANKDRNGKLRVAYWATGTGGAEVEMIDEMTGEQGKTYQFTGPKKYGNQTRLVPAIKDFLSYFRGQVATGARQGCAVFITDGQLHDADGVKELSAQVAAQIASGKLPRVNFILVGVGDQVNEEQLEEVCHEEYPGVGHLWCHRIAEEIKQLAELVTDDTKSFTLEVGGQRYTQPLPSERHHDDEDEDEDHH